LAYLVLGEDDVEEETVQAGKPSQTQAVSADKEDEEVFFFPTGFAFVRDALVPPKGSPEMDAVDRFMADPKLRKNLSSNEASTFPKQPPSFDGHAGR
jgi:hypothetical protein